jgi:hypothetical protein
VLGLLPPGEHPIAVNNNNNNNSNNSKKKGKAIPVTGRGGP